MNTTDTIGALLKQGCKTVAFMHSPEGACVVQAEQIVVTGPKANFARIAHQYEGEDFVHCLNQLVQNASHVAELKTMIVLPMKRH
jgi:hypothetical protein